MDTLTTIQERRSIKHYDSAHRLSEDEINQLVSFAMLSPTSFNIQNWRFVVVQDEALREKVKAAAWGQAQVTEASALFIMCADLKAWEKDPGRYWKDAPEKVRDTMVPMIGNFYQGKESLQRDEALRSCGIAGQTLMLTAKEMGYDSNPMIGFDAEQVAQLINLPKDHIVCYMIVVGKAVKKAWPRGGQLKIDEVMIRNQF